jgi:hypothetical protein
MNKSGNSKFHGSIHEIEATITISHNKSTIKNKQSNQINNNTQQNRKERETGPKLTS